MWKKFFVLLPVFYSAASLAASPVQFDVSAGFSRDDNITRAELDTDIVEDDIISAGASASYKLAINDISYTSFKASVDLSQYQDFDKLSSTVLGLQATYHIKPSAGYTAIRYFVLAAYDQRMVDSDQREGSAIELRAGLSKRLTDRISFRAGLGRESISADSSVFDEDNTKIYVDFDYRLTDNNTLYFTVSTIDGDVVATAVPTTKLVNATRPEDRVRDDAFLALAPDRWAYRLSADTNAFTLGDTYSIDSMQAIDISVFYYDTSAYQDNDYSGTIIDLSYIYRF